MAHIRALNAQNNGSLIEICEGGAKPDLVIASPRLEISDIWRVSDAHALIAMTSPNPSGERGEVARLDITARKITKRSSFKLPLGNLQRILHRPGDDRIVVVGRRFVSVLDAETLAVQKTWHCAKKISDDLWTLRDAAELTREEMIQTTAGRQGDASFWLNPPMRTATWRADGTLRMVSTTDFTIEHGKGYFSTFRREFALMDIDLEKGTLSRRIVWSEYSDKHESDHTDIIAIDPTGTRALVRNPDRRVAQSLVLQPPKQAQGKSGWFDRIFSKAAPEKEETAPRELIECYMDVWNLDTLTQETPIKVATYDIASLEKESWINQVPPAPARVKAPPEPRAMSGPPPYRDSIPLERRLAGLPATVLWSEDDGFVALMHGGLLRQRSTDGQLGPWLRPTPALEFGIGSSTRSGNMTDVTLRWDGANTVILENRRNTVRVLLPPFAPADLDDETVIDIPATVEFDTVQWGKDLKTVASRMLRLRTGNVAIRDKSPEAVASGLEKMAETLRTQFHDVVHNDEWTPTLVVKGRAFTETGFCKVLLEHPSDRGLAALSGLISAFVRHQPEAAQVIGEDPYMRCMTESMMAALLLSDHVPAPCWRWICYRDASHNETFCDLLNARVFQDVGIARPDLQKLAVRVSVQDFLAGHIPGSFLDLSLMKLVASQMNRGAVAPEGVASMIVQQVQAELRLSKAPHGSVPTAASVLRDIVQSIEPKTDAESAVMLKIGALTE